MRQFASIVLVVIISNLSIGQSNSNEKIKDGQNPAHFHHVHLNVTNPELTITFYEKFFGANRISYKSKSKSLFTERSFILMDSVKVKPPTNIGSSLWHIGWAGVDGYSEFQWRVKDGIEVQTPLTKLVVDPSRPEDSTHYMYFWGPDRELIEVYTGSRNHLFEHVHLLATDIEATTAWFKEYLGLTPTFAKAVSFLGLLLNIIRVDNVNIIIFAKPAPDIQIEALPEEVWPKEGFKITDGTAIDHIGFSYESIGPVFQRMRSSGVPIVRGMQTNPKHGLTGFFVRGPDGLLIEIVKEKPVPEGIWIK
jgi:catechol 2,3-dioxygenase-like lactoylglutathione lyase family enzyme